MVTWLWTTLVHRRSHLHLLRSNELEIERYGYGISRHIQQNFIDIVEETEYTEKTTDLPQETPYTYIQRSLLFPCHVFRWPFVIRWWFSFIQPILDIRLRAMVMVFNDTFNNISVTSILWPSALLVEETGLPRESYRPVACHWQTLSHNIVSNTPRHNRDSNSHL